MHRNITSTKRFVTLILLFLLLSSHELFLKSDTCILEKFSPYELYLFNGTFDESENVITRNRIVNACVIGPNYEFKPSTDDYYDRDNITYLKFKTGNEGTYLAGISTKPRTIELSGEDFENYLAHEGLTKISMDRKRKGISNESAFERYSKHVKVILQVENQKTDHFSRELKYPIEFIPLKNPYELSIDDQMSFKLLFMGKPLENQIVHIGSRQSAADKGKKELSARTNEEGEFSFTISEKGHWYVATIQMEESNEENLDYESNWATLTFEVK